MPLKFYTVASFQKNVWYTSCGGGQPVGLVWVVG